MHIYISIYVYISSNAHRLTSPNVQAKTYRVFHNKSSYRNNCCLCVSDVRIDLCVLRVCCKARGHVQKGKQQQQQRQNLFL